MPTRKSLFIEWLLRAFAIAAYLVMIGAVAVNWIRDTSQYSLLLLLVSEGITLGLIVFARAASLRDASLIPVLATIYTTTFFLFLDPDPTIRLIPEWAAGILQGLGLIWQMYSKITLGRSFGVLPAARGLVVSGPYRFMRHPIYLAYLVGELGFLLANASVRNLLLIVALFLTHLIRMLREETALESSEFGAAYSQYKSKVRYRLLPKIF